MACKTVYNKLTNKYRELVDQFQYNILNGIPNTRELDCIITKARGLIFVYNKGFLKASDLEKWTEEVSEIVEEDLICEDIEDDGNTEEDKYIWLPVSPDCETENLIWEGYDPYCQDKDLVL